jgi:pimeloyl-ACP methyl ester carboxylesterase
MTDRHILRWSPTPEAQNLIELPSHITRHFIQTPRGKLEMLVAQPPSSPATEHQPRKKALLFQHGGFGCAAVWIPFLTFFSQTHGFPCYALSLRGHGASWKPGFWELVFRTGLGSMVEDLGYAFTWVAGFESARRLGENGLREEDVVLIGHSAGGGLSQYFLSSNRATVGALVIVAGIPCFGG